MLFAFFLSCLLSDPTRRFLNCFLGYDVEETVGHDVGKLYNIGTYGYPDSCVKSHEWSPNSDANTEQYADYYTLAPGVSSMPPVPL